jgi:transcriptional antiterminator RfaH
MLVRRTGDTLVTDPLPTTPELNWYAVYTKKTKEHVADTKLIQLNIETFLPLLRRRIRRKYQLRPLFPCYLFARFDPRRWLYTVNHLEGVNRVVCFDNQPVPVPVEIIERMKLRMGDQGYWVPETEIVPGNRVRVRSGAFSGLEGRIAELKPRDRVVLLLEAIFSGTRVEMDRDLVETIREYTP